MSAAANENRRTGPADGIAARNIELDYAMREIERELGHLDVHQRIVIANAIDAFADRVRLRCDPWC